MGISVYYIPQCTGEKPIQFFLYPGHLRRLITTLQKLYRRMMKFPEPRRDHARDLRWRRKTRRKKR